MLYANRVIRFSFIGVVLFVAFSFFWSLHIRHQADRQKEATAKKLERFSQSEPIRTAPQFETPSFTEPGVHLENTLIADDTSAASAVDLSPVDFFDRSWEAAPLPAQGESLPDEDTEEILTSPNGFGPLPPVPPDYPNQNVWAAWRLARITPEHELLSRVRIELWHQGIRTEGAVYRLDYGLIFPTIEDIVYIQWGDSVAADGKWYVIRMLGTPSTINQYEEDIYRGIFPPHLTIYEFPDGGIDPYAFLGLSR